MSIVIAEQPPVKVKHSKENKHNVPPLESGDRLTRKEFERRYEAMPHLKKAELIGGKVYMAAAVRRSHGKAHGEVIGWLLNYCVATPGVELIDNATVRLDESNEPQPDASLRIETESIGSSRVSEDDYIEGPPELAVEIAGSSASYDLHEKLEAYQQNGIQEYVIWQIYENHLNWFQLVAGRYEPLLPDKEGIIRSCVFPGLHLNVESLLAGDMGTVLAVLQKGVQTEEHQHFINRLQEK